MKKLYILGLLLLCSFSIIYAQPGVEVVASSTVSTSKKTDFVRYAVEMDNGNVVAFVQDYKSEITFIHEFDKKMKLKKSYKMKGMKHQIGAVKLDGNDLKVFAFDATKGYGYVYKVDLSKAKFELVKKNIFEVDLVGSAWRNKKYKSDKTTNNYDEIQYGDDLGFYGKGFYSDGKSFYFVMYRLSVPRNVSSIFYNEDKTSKYVIAMMDSNFNFIKNIDVELDMGSENFERFKTHDVQYSEQHKTFLFNGSFSPKLDNNARKKEKEQRINQAQKGVFIVRENEKPKLLKFHKVGEYMADSNVKMDNKTLLVASSFFKGEYDGKENKDIHIKISEYNMDDLSEISTTEIPISTYRFAGSTAEGTLFNGLTLPLFEKVDGRYIVGLYNYETGFPEYSGKYQFLVTHNRSKGQYHLFNINVNDSSLLNHYIFDKSVDQKYSNTFNPDYDIWVNGQWEFWNRGINGIYKDGKTRFFINATDVTQEGNTIHWKGVKSRDDREFLNSKPYVVTIDFDEGVDIHLLGKKTTNIDGVMIEQMAEIKEGAYITNTPDTKKKKYVKIILD